MRAIKTCTFLAFVILALCGSNAARSQEWLYTVRPGDNLWTVTAAHLTKMDYWPRLQVLNEISDPERLPPGMKLRIPIAWLKRLPATAQVLNAHGQSQALIAATNRTVALSPGQLLESGDTVLTGPEGNVTLEFGDGSRLLVQANSQLNLKSLNAYGRTKVRDTLLQLLRGRVDNEVNPQLGAGAQYEISTPVATSAVRGTRFRLGMDAETATARTEVLEGRVEFRSGRKAQAVATNRGSLAESGKPLLPPVPLLQPPVTADLPPIVTRVPIKIALPEVKGAVAYRAQIAPDNGFATLLFDGVSATPAVNGPDLPDGDYVLRVRGIDAKGLEGRDAYHAFRLHARPEPPFLMQPAHESMVLEKSLTFKWSEPEKAVSYHFQLAQDERFTAPLLDVPEHTRSDLKPDRALEPRNYYWRVGVRDSSGRQGPFSDPQAFKLQPTPELQPPEVSADAMTFRWSAGLPGERYQFQLARDANFEDVLVSSEVAEPHLSVPRPSSGFHYLRIRTIDASGAAGPYGPTQRIDVPPASYWPLGLVVFLTLVLVL
ncbi:MAG: FecR domain-containing protein [Candidatus Competibacteraceae bacterium]|nr:FecR domain-containing protein [Candidatus Competibacteraceae bacterium]